MRCWSAIDALLPALAWQSIANSNGKNSSPSGRVKGPRLQRRRTARDDARVRVERAIPGPSVTLRDVAAAAGVHPATASRALNTETRSLVNAETAQRVLDAAAGLGYRP